MSDKEIAECVILMLAMFVIVMLSFASDKIISPINTHSVIKSEKIRKENIPMPDILRHWSKVIKENI